MYISRGAAMNGKHLQNVDLSVLWRIVYVTCSSPLRWSSWSSTNPSCVRKSPFQVSFFSARSNFTLTGRFYFQTDRCYSWKDQEKYLDALAWSEHYIRTNYGLIKICSMHIYCCTPSLLLLQNKPEPRLLWHLNFGGKQTTRQIDNDSK